MKIAHKNPTGQEKQESQLRIRFKTPAAKQAHIKLVRGTNKVGRSEIRIGPLKF